MQRIISSKGLHDKIYNNGYEYQYNKMHGSNTYYRCVRYCRTKCPGRLVFNEKKEIIITKPHSHAGDSRNIAKAALLDTIKNEAKVNKESAKNIISAACVGLSEPVAAYIPSVKLISETVRRMRNKENVIANPKTLLELEFDEMFQFTEKKEKFLLFDSGPAEDRLVIFATRKNLSFLSQCDSMYMDGTFSIVPSLFKQLYTIHGM